MKPLSILLFIFSIITIKSQNKTNFVETFLGSVNETIITNFENKFYQLQNINSDNEIVSGVYDNGDLRVKNDKISREEIYERDMDQYSKTWEQILTRGHYNEDIRELFDVPSHVNNILGENWTKFTLIYQSINPKKDVSLNCIFFIMMKKENKFSIVYLIMKNLSFKIPLNIGKTYPLILITSSNSNKNILIGENKYEPFEIDETCLNDEEKDLLIQYFNVNAVIFLNGEYRINDLNYPNLYKA